MGAFKTVFGAGGGEITPTNPSRARGIITVLDETGTAESADITVQIAAAPSGSGFAYDDKPWTTKGDFDGLIVGATYNIWRGDPSKVSVYSFTVADDAAGTTFNIDSLIGRDE